MESQPSKKAAKNKKQSKKENGNPTPGKWEQMNRKQRRDMMRKMQNDDLSLEVVRPDAAGIDIGNESHYVAVPPSRDPQAVRCFGCTTTKLKAMADWLKQCRIRTVAMQSTGAYWVAVFDILEAAGLEVFLVNAREDEESTGPQNGGAGEPLAHEAAHLWLTAEFVPSVPMLRTFWRQRNDLVQSAARHIQRMQKH